jgi:predicted Rdx family selenoprotein
MNPAPMTYAIEIYEPNTSTAIRASFCSQSPFMPFEIGALIAAAGRDGAAGLLRVVGVVHHLTQTDALTHTASIFTKTVDDAQSVGQRRDELSPLSRLKDLKDRVKDVVDPARLRAYWLLAPSALRRKTVLVVKAAENRDLLDGRRGRRRSR